ncbi:MAG: MarC family protein [Bacteroidales bacterium]
MGLEFSFKEIFSAFIVLFAVIDITGSSPIILGLKEAGKKVEPAKAAILSFALFMAFLFGGKAILALFSVDIQSFAVAGAIVIFILALEMVLDIEIFKYDGPSGSATIVPIIFPLVAGAGALTTVLSLRAEYRPENIVAALILNMIIVYFVLKKVDIVEKLIGKGGVYLMRKFFGIILLAMAVKLFSNNVGQLFL